MVLCFKPFTAWEVDGKRGSARGGSDRIEQEVESPREVVAGRSPLGGGGLGCRVGEEVGGFDHGVPQLGGGRTGGGRAAALGVG